jgi:NAD(P)H-hydrate epimerase
MYYSLYSYTNDDLSSLPARYPESNKGTYGRLLCICGSEGMCGAAYLSAKAAYRTGAGLVKILTASANIIPLQTSLPEAIVASYDKSGELDRNALLDSIEWADAIVIGCGLGRSALSRTIVSTVLRNTDKPLVIDADALNIISANTSLKKYLCKAIITPHVLEMSRLTGIAVDDILNSPEQTAYDFARANGTVCVLKKNRTVISDGGEKLYVNTSGNNGMATGGSGDVLSGVIGGLLAQKKNSELSMLDLAALGVYIHGLAGDVAKDRLGEYSLIASDIIDALPEILKK